MVNVKLVLASAGGGLAVLAICLFVYYQSIKSTNPSSSITWTNDFFLEASSSDNLLKLNLLFHHDTTSSSDFVDYDTISSSSDTDLAIINRFTTASTNYNGIPATFVSPNMVMSAFNKTSKTLTQGYENGRIGLVSCSNSFDFDTINNILKVTCGSRSYTLTLDAKTLFPTTYGGMGVTFFTYGYQNSTSAWKSRSTAKVAWPVAPISRRELSEETSRNLATQVTYSNDMIDCAMSAAAAAYKNGASSSTNYFTSWNNFSYGPNYACEGCTYPMTFFTDPATSSAKGRFDTSNSATQTHSANNCVINGVTYSVIGFKGTEFSSITDISNDLKGVVDNFASGYQQALSSNPFSGRYNICTGHSLGAVIAKYAGSLGLCDRVITFASPLSSGDVTTSGLATQGILQFARRTGLPNNYAGCCSWDGMWAGYCLDQSGNSYWYSSGSNGGYYGWIVDPVTTIGNFAGQTWNQKPINVGTYTNGNNCFSSTYQAATSLVYGFSLHSANPLGAYGQYRPANGNWN